MTEPVLWSAENCPSREQLLEAAKNRQVLASRGEGTLLAMPSVRELIAEGKGEIVEGIDVIGGAYTSFLNVTDA